MSTVMVISLLFLIYNISPPEHHTSWSSIWSLWYSISSSSELFSVSSCDWFCSEIHMQFFVTMSMSFTITLSSKFAIKKSLNIPYHNSPASLRYLVKLSCSKIVNYIVGLYYKRLMTMKNYTIKSIVVLIRTFLRHISQQVCTWTMCD